MSDLDTIADREQRPVSEIELLIARWCAPIPWAMPTAAAKALANDPTWRQWVDYDHPWLAEAGYYDSATTTERRLQIAQQFREESR